MDASGALGPAVGLEWRRHTRKRRRRSALAITDTDDTLIAALASIGLSRSRRTGRASRRRSARPDVVNKSEEQVLTDVADRRSAEPRALERCQSGRPSPTSPQRSPSRRRCRCPSRCRRWLRSAGASLMPSPAIATMRPCCLQSLHDLQPSSGSTSASIIVEHELLANRLSGRPAVAGHHPHVDAFAAQLAERLGRQWFA
jgi:hypothetical protein